MFSFSYKLNLNNSWYFSCGGTSWIYAIYFVYFYFNVLSSEPINWAKDLIIPHLMSSPDISGTVQNLNWSPLFYHSKRPSHPNQFHPEYLSSLISTPKKSILCFICLISPVSWWIPLWRSLQSMSIFSSMFAPIARITWCGFFNISPE